MATALRPHLGRQTTPTFRWLFSWCVSTSDRSELSGETIAIDDRYSTYNSSVRTAIVAAGAAEVQLSESQTTAINRMVSGEVPAAVLALVSAEAAESFPEIAGFRIFHIPFSPRSVSERP